MTLSEKANANDSIFTMNNSNHHLVPESRGGTRYHLNIKPLADNLHKSFHVVFSNMTPIEQLRYIKSLNTSALEQDVIRRIDKVLDYYK